MAPKIFCTSGVKPEISLPALSRRRAPRSEEHTSELQSQSNIVCRLLLEQKTTFWSSRLPADSPSATGFQPVGNAEAIVVQSAFSRLPQLASASVPLLVCRPVEKSASSRL